MNIETTPSKSPSPGDQGVDVMSAPLLELGSSPLPPSLCTKESMGDVMSLPSSAVSPGLLSQDHTGVTSEPAEVSNKGDSVDFCGSLKENGPQREQHY